MRTALLIATAAAFLVGCTAQQPSPEAVARADQRLAEATRGLVPGEAQSCISSLGLRGPTQIDPSTLIYRTGANQVYVNRLSAPCPGLDQSDTVLVVRPLTGSQFCDGDMFTLVDRTSRFPRGTCNLGRFTPYRKAN